MNQRTMSEEARKALLGLLPISGNGFGFIPDIYPEKFKDFSPTVYIKMFTVDDRKQHDTEIQSNDIHDVVLKFAYGCLVDIKNLFDLSTGQEIDVPKKDGVIDYDWFKSQPVSLIYSIYKKINEISSLKSTKEVDEKEGLE